jgi:hypothetical protein
MKFWKPVLLTTALFSAFTATLLYSSCEKDPCVNVSCKNGGSCNGGACVCPTGYEGPTCETKMVARFVGVFAGYSTCNNGAMVIDTVWIYDNIPRNPAGVSLLQKLHDDDLLTGTVNNNVSTYAISIPDVVAANYYKKYHVTLQSDDKLTLDTYERDARVPGDTVINHCIFVGNKVQN